MGGKTSAVVRRRVRRRGGAHSAPRATGSDRSWGVASARAFADRAFDVGQQDREDQPKQFEHASQDRRFGRPAFCPPTARGSGPKAWSLPPAHAAHGYVARPGRRRPALADTDVTRPSYLGLGWREDSNRTLKTQMTHEELVALQLPKKLTLPQKCHKH